MDLIIKSPIKKPLVDFPESVQTYVGQMIALFQPEKIILFGSRARGDHRTYSDFDFALVGSYTTTNWANAKTSIDEMNLTLFPIDLMRLEELGPDYQKNIEAEGRLIYERRA